MHGHGAGEECRECFHLVEQERYDFKHIRGGELCIRVGGQGVGFQCIEGPTEVAMDVAELRGVENDGGGLDRGCVRHGG